MEYDVCMLRAVKSEAEIEVIRYAYHIAQRGIEAAIDAIKDGAYEREVAAIVEYTIRMAGAEGTGVDTMVGSGENACHVITRTSFRQMKEGDFVHLTVAPRYEGYHGAIARPIFIGDHNKEAQKALLAAKKLMRNAMLLSARALKAEKLKPLPEGSWMKQALKNTSSTQECTA